MCVCVRVCVCVGVGGCAEAVMRYEARQSVFQAYTYMSYDDEGGQTVYMLLLPSTYMPLAVLSQLGEVLPGNGGEER